MPKIRNYDAELVPTKIVNFDRTNLVNLSLNYADRSHSIRKINNVWNWKVKNPLLKDVQGREVDYFIHSLDELKGSCIEQYKQLT